MSSIDELFTTLTETQKDRKLPPVHLWQPSQVGEIDIAIDAQGDWFHEGERIQRQALVDLFATILRFDDNAYFLVTPAEKLRIQVADVPFVAIDMDVRGTGSDMDLLFTTNVGDYVMADQTHAITMRREIPYLEVRDQLAARLSRSVYYRLVELGVEMDGELNVFSQGARFCLGQLD